MRSLKQKKQQCLDTYRASGGQVAKSCYACKISKSTFHSWKNSDPDFKDAVTLIDDSLVEEVENFVWKKIQEGSDLWIWRYLKSHKPEKWKDEFRHTNDHSGILKLEVVNKLIGTTPLPETPNDVPNISTDITPTSSDVPE